MYLVREPGQDIRGIDNFQHLVLRRGGCAEPERAFGFARELGRSLFFPRCLLRRDEYLVALLARLPLKVADCAHAPRDYAHNHFVCTALLGSLAAGHRAVVVLPPKAPLAPDCGVCADVQERKGLAWGRRPYKDNHGGAVGGPASRQDGVVDDVVEVDGRKVAHELRGTVLVVVDRDIGEMAAPVLSLQPLLAARAPAKQVQTVGDGLAAGEEVDDEEVGRTELKVLVGHGLHVVGGDDVWNLGAHVVVIDAAPGVFSGWNADCLRVLACNLAEAAWVRRAAWRRERSAGFDGAGEDGVLAVLRGVAAWLFAVRGLGSICELLE